MRRRICLALAAAIALFGFGVPQLVAFAGTGDREDTSEASRTKTSTPIKHFITLMQENHSFDNYFGTYPGAEGIPPGTCVPVDPDKPSSRCVSPYHLSGRSIVSLGHNVGTFRKQANGGRMDGFISSFANERGVGDQAMGYYDDSDIGYYWNIADNYVLFDQAFTSAAGGSVWNHFYWVTGSPGNPDEDSLLADGFDHVPTIFDRLEKAGVSWKFYIQNYDPEITFRDPGNGDRAAQIIWAPVLNYNRFIDDPKLASHIVPLEQYFTDLREGTLPAVSYMVPAGSSEHPPGSIQAGTRFVRNLINELMASSAWDSSAFVWTYDDWGGWYDHVRPPKVDKYGYGFRAPCLLVSAYARRGEVNHTTIDFTSQLKFIENNWGVPPLAERDAAASDIVSAFDFSSPPRPPVILSEARHVPAVKAPSVTAVYVLYGMAAAVLLSLLTIGRLTSPSARARVAAGAAK